MHTLYNIGVALYGLGIRIASLFNKKAKKWLSGRVDLYSAVPEIEGREVIWFHCASLGEFDQGLPLMEKIKRECPDCFLLVTFFSPSGMEFYNKRRHSADHVMYLPLDTPSKAKRFINEFSPSKAFFVKYEFWGNVILEAKSIGTEIYNVSGLFRSKQRFFKWHGAYFRKVLKQFNWLFVQNEESKKLLQSIGIENVSVTGDSRFDRVLENKRHVTKNEIIENFKNGQELLIIGSSWPEDEKVLLPWVSAQNYKVLIAPHNVDELHVKSIIKKLDSVVRYTEVNGDISDVKVLVLDTIGQLSNAYSYGEIAYIGGGFSGSLHNILEPAVFGLPVLFGPNHSRFPEAKKFINNGFGFSIQTTIGFGNSFLNIKENRETIMNKEIDFVQQNAGASDRIFEHVFKSS